MRSVGGRLVEEGHNLTGVSCNKTSSLASWLQRVGDLSVDLGYVAVRLGSLTGWDVYVNGGNMA